MREQREPAHSIIIRMLAHIEGICVHSTQSTMCSFVAMEYITLRLCIDSTQNATKGINQK